MIKQCTCTHKGQDKLHGKGQRVFNKKATDPKRPQEYSCTVCNRVVSD